MYQIHGGDLRNFPDFLDFSANINPLGMPEKVRQAVIDSACSWEHYPDPDCTALRLKIAEKLGVAPNRTVCGNGADDLIWRIIHSLRPRSALIAVPTFSEYERTLAEYGCSIRKFSLKEEDGFRLGEDFIRQINSSTEIVILCSPNNPTGLTADGDLLAECAQRCKSCGAFFMCDESFLGFVPEHERHSLLDSMSDRCIVLSSMTKLYALPGLRIGYAVFGSDILANMVQNSGQYWSVSSPAEAAGCAALECTEYKYDTARLISCEREFLANQLESAGAKVFPSQANFILFKAVKGLDDLLINSKILIRNCSSFSGLSPEFYRVAVRTHEDNMLLTEAVRRYLNG